MADDGGDRVRQVRPQLRQAPRRDPAVQPHDDAPHLDLDLDASPCFGCCRSARQARYERHEGRAFLARHPGFAVTTPAELLAPLGERALIFRQAVLMSDEGLQMTPRRTDTDGFFVSVMVKK